MEQKPAVLSSWQKFTFCLVKEVSS